MFISQVHFWCKILKIPMDFRGNIITEKSCIKVDLPEPLVAIKAVLSPLSMPKFTSENNVLIPKDLEMELTER